MSNRGYEALFNPKQTPQTEPIPGKQQVANNAGGYVFAINKWEVLRRFLILGSEAGSYYVQARALTRENALTIQKCVEEDGYRVIQTALEVSERGLAPKNEPALFVLAMCTASKDREVRKAAWQALPRVARTATHLFQFANFRQVFGGWGRLTREGFSNWYTSKSESAIAHQALKYQNREGWSHRDLLRKCHATGTVAQNNVFAAITHPDKIGELQLPELYEGAELVKKATTAKEVIDLVEKYNLTREMVPNKWFSNPEIWEALLKDMPMAAMVRNLGNMSKSGLLVPFSNAARTVCERLEDADRIRKARLHPLNLLVAMRTYAQGRGVRGKGEWKVVPDVVDALDTAMLLSFEYAEPSGLRTLFGVDVSGSMRWATAIESVTCAEAAAVMALVGVKREPQCFIGGFSTVFIDLGITRKDTFKSALQKTIARNFGATNCAKPISYALQHKIPVDVFEILTDNETFAGRKGHPSQVLDTYRQKTGIPAKMVVVGMTSTGFSIADPNDPGMLDVVGMDTSVPAVIANWARG